MTDGVGWDEVYERHGATGVGWHQEEPCTSLELIALAGAAPSDPIIDVGAGMATLADRLVARGMSDVSVLDAENFIL